MTHICAHTRSSVLESMPCFLPNTWKLISKRLIRAKSSGEKITNETQGKMKCQNVAFEASCLANKYLSAPVAVLLHNTISSYARMYLWQKKINDWNKHTMKNQTIYLFANHVLKAFARKKPDLPEISIRKKRLQKHDQCLNLPQYNHSAPYYTRTQGIEWCACVPQTQSSRVATLTYS